MKRVDSSASEISTMSGENGDDTIYHVRKSKLLSLINWTHVITVYSPQIFLVLIVSLLAQLLLNFEKTLELHFNSNYFHMDMTLRESTSEDLWMLILPSMTLHVKSLLK